MSLYGTETKRRRTYCIEFFSIFFVVSRYSVSFGGFLWNTTLFMEDFPLLEMVRLMSLARLKQTDLF